MTSKRAIILECIVINLPGKSGATLLPPGERWKLQPGPGGEIAAPGSTFLQKKGRKEGN